ncbi:MAG TPA: hypothetical protein VFK30_08700 [Anaerolineae bacterium]|nr:hypothetical protein [Anaerolineae bacterium]
MVNFSQGRLALMMIFTSSGDKTFWAWSAKAQVAAQFSGTLPSA